MVSDATVILYVTWQALPLDCGPFKGKLVSALFTLGLEVWNSGAQYKLAEDV